MPNTSLSRFGSASQPVVALYARVSSEEQADRGTIEAQVTLLRGLADLHGWIVHDLYADDGVAGTRQLHERPEGRRLLEDAKAGRFSEVVVFRLDRLGRSLTALLEAHRRLEVAGVCIRSATEPFDTSNPMGRFLFQLIGSMAELDRSTMQERMTMGRDRRARDGRWTGGSIPFGYDLDDEHRLTPSERLVPGVGMTEADFIRDLFARLANGSSLGAECARLNSLGVSTARRWGNGAITAPASVWATSRLHYMVKNTVYIGTHVVKSHHAPVVRSVPPLLDLATWERARAQVAENRRLPKPNASRTYLLRGLVRCVTPTDDGTPCNRVHVGAPMHGPKGWLRHYYRCSAQMRPLLASGLRPCPAKNLPALWLEDFVWKDCRAFILHPEKALATVRQRMQERRRQATVTGHQRRPLEQALSTKAGERERVMTLFRRGRATLQDTERQLDAIEAEVAALSAQLDVVQAQADLARSFEAEYANAETFLRSLREQLATIEAAGDDAMKRDIMKGLVSEIRVMTTGSGRNKVAHIAVDYIFADLHAAEFKTACRTEFSNMMGVTREVQLARR